MFLNEDASRQFYLDWEKGADDIVAAMRGYAGKHPHDKQLTDLIGELVTRSDAFRTRWAAHNVRFHRTGVKRLHHVDLKVGNTQVVAEMIAARADVDVYRIEAANPYPHDYEETVARNVREEQDDSRPKIAGPLPSLDGYDTVLLGSPVWNVQEPMIMRTFIEGLDWAGKTAHPFVTYAVSGMGNAQDDYTRLLTGATVSDGLAVQGETVRDSLPQIQAWLRRINLA